PRHPERLVLLKYGVQVKSLLIASDTPIYKIVERLGQENIIVQAKIGARGEKTKYSYPGFVYIKERLSTVFRSPDVLFKDPQVKEQLNNIFFEFILPASYQFIAERSNIVSAKGSLDALEIFFQWCYMSVYNILEPDAKLEQKNAVKKYIALIFKEKFKNKYDNTISDPEKGEDYIENLFIESIQYAALMFFFEEIKERYGIKEIIEGENLAFYIESYFLNFGKNELKDLIRRFVKTELPRVLLRFAESFNTGTLTKTMWFSKHNSFQIGWEHETMTLLFIAPYFLLKEFIKNNYNLNNLKLFDAFVFNPSGIRSSDLIKDMSRILKGKELKDILRIMNNDFDMFGNIDNFRLSDLFSTLIPNYGLFNWECKNSQDSDSDYLKDVVVDVYSTIFAAMCRSVALESVNIEDQYEHMVVAIDPDNPSSVYKFIKKLVGIRKPEDMRASKFESEEEIEEGEGKRKYSKYIELYSKIADIINDRIHANDKSIFIDQLVKIFAQKSFNNEVKEIARNIFGATRADEMYELVKDKFEIDKLPRWTGGKLNIDNLLIQDANGFYRIEIGTTFNIYKQTSIELTAQMLRNIPFFIVYDQVENKWKEKNYYQFLMDATENEIKGSWAIVHNNKGENGLALVNRPQVELPKDIYDGFKSPDTEKVEEGVFISRNGFLLVGRIYFDPITEKFATANKDLIVKNLDDDVQEQFASFIDPITGEVVKGFPFAPEIKKYYSFDYLRSASQKAGSQITYILQQVHSRIIPSGPHLKIVSGYKAIESLSYSLKISNFLDQNFFNHPNRIFIKENAVLNLKELSIVISKKIKIKDYPQSSYLDDKLLRILNSYEDSSGIHLGQDRKEIKNMLKLVIFYGKFKNIKNFDYSKDNLIYELFSVDLSGRGSLYSIRNLVFRRSQTRKVWFNNWLEILKKINPDILDQNDPLEKKLYNALVKDGNPIFSASDSLLIE
ncbi:MAG: hypothetical protein ACTSRZ_20440, partial [Promethearchaeota archaeon]